MSRPEEAVLPDGEPRIHRLSPFQPPDGLVYTCPRCWSLNTLELTQRDLQAFMQNQHLFCNSCNRISPAEEVHLNRVPWGVMMMWRGMLRDELTPQSVKNRAENFPDWIEVDW